MQGVSGRVALVEGVSGRVALVEGVSGRVALVEGVSGRVALVDAVCLMPCTPLLCLRPCTPLLCLMSCTPAGLQQGLRSVLFAMHPIISAAPTPAALLRHLIHPLIRCVCACGRVCVRERIRVCVCVCECVCASCDSGKVLVNPLYPQILFPFASQHNR